MALAVATPVAELPKAGLLKSSVARSVAKAAV
jgi:hypothetical protein